MLQSIVIAATEGESRNPLLPESYDIIWSAVCFVVILFFFWRLVLPRMKKMLDERSAAIEGNIEKADVAQREAEAALEQYTAQLAEARAEAAKIREQARVDAQRIGSEIQAQAQTDAERTKANAQVAIEAERQSALVSLRSEVGSLAIDLASGVVGESLSDDQKATALVDRFLADLEASDTAGKK
ncbi:MAG: F0F1 ATP synthase subunit B [Herbiconiux sp.]|uniref:F0F1 ATP synthase subunit B n=1 Tax=Herbiconiux sp. TaxID=1871186 RepID=UPI0011FA7868|nr:F0F1 ATP synthase subunit B [Herbiconiux sp.]TAJ49731.1 MAG: F0F1 ATP synthase subunit B [Herbiconiux sp.]